MIIIVISNNNNNNNNNKNNNNNNDSNSNNNNNDNDDNNNNNNNNSNIDNIKKKGNNDCDKNNNDDINDYQNGDISKDKLFVSYDDNRQSVGDSFISLKVENQNKNIENYLMQKLLANLSQYRDNFNFNNIKISLLSIFSFILKLKLSRY